MNRYLNASTAKLKPYIPGEQPQDKKYIKLNTNECPYPPSPNVTKAIKNFESKDLRLYPDPESSRLKSAAAKRYKLHENQIFIGGGSDEILAYAFMAFCEREEKVYFPNITYGFYRVYADLFGLKSVEVPLLKDFSLEVEDYFNLDGNIFVANPNAPTGICLDPSQIEKILQNNPKRVVVIDEAYIDFAQRKSCVELIKFYDNLLVVQTCSKSRSLAGMRLGFAFGQRELIAGLEKIKFSFNPYNIDRISTEVGIASLEDEEYFNATVKEVAKTREWMKGELEKRGFFVLNSESNFLLAKSSLFTGEKLYLLLRDKGILVRHFKQAEIEDYIRISIGTNEDMYIAIEALDDILENDEEVRR